MQCSTTCRPSRNAGAGLPRRALAALVLHLGGGGGPGVAAGLALGGGAGQQPAAGELPWPLPALPPSGPQQAAVPAWPSLDLAVSVPELSGHAALQVRKRRSGTAASRAAAGTPVISGSTCNMAAAKLGAMSCSLVTQVSATPEGCECRFDAAECPPPDAALGFTGVSPSAAVEVPEVPGLTVILCLFWQWPNPSPFTWVPPAKVQRRTQQLARQFGDEARVAAAAAAQKYMEALRALTTLPPAPPDLANPGPAVPGQQPPADLGSSR